LTTRTAPASNATASIVRRDAEKPNVPCWYKYGGYLNRNCLSASKLFSEGRACSFARWQLSWLPTPPIQVPLVTSVAGGAACRGKKNAELQTRRLRSFGEVCVNSRVRDARPH